MRAARMGFEKRAGRSVWAANPCDPLRLGSEKRASGNN
jgi:hypothetical protein